MSAHPSSAHDWAIWLSSSLVGVEAMGQGLYQGQVPDDLDFNEIVDKIGVCCPALLGMRRVPTRTIEFNPAVGHVYDSIEKLIAVPSNRQKIPTQFTINDQQYTYPSEPIPLSVVSYIAAVDLWEMLHSLTDHVSEAPPTLHFIKSHDSRVDISLLYSVSDEVDITEIKEFGRDFVKTELHKEQKRNMVRSTIIDKFKGKPQISLADVLLNFRMLYDEIKSSYAIYAADFSYEKIRSEIEKQNLEDTLRLNKTLAEIPSGLFPCGIDPLGSGGKTLPPLERNSSSLVDIRRPVTQCMKRDGVWSGSRSRALEMDSLA